MSTLWGVFAAAFLSATLLIGVSEAALIAAARYGTMDRLALFTAATTGNVLGAMVNYALGAWALRFEGRRWFPVSSRARQKAERVFARFGYPVLLLSWLPIIGDPLTVAAGMLRMPFALFFVLVAIGKAARYAVLLWLVS